MKDNTVNEEFGSDFIGFKSNPNILSDDDDGICQGEDKNKRYFKKEQKVNPILLPSFQMETLSIYQRPSAKKVNDTKKTKKLLDNNKKK
jgi:hypothetical protein